MNKPRKPRRELLACPHCGADVAVGAKVCRECGSDATAGWQTEEEVDYQSLDLPEGYSQDPEHPGALLSSKRSPWLVVVAIVAALALLAFTVLR